MAPGSGSVVAALVRATTPKNEIKIIAVKNMFFWFIVLFCLFILFCLFLIREIQQPLFLIYAPDNPCQGQDETTLPDNLQKRERLFFLFPIKILPDMALFFQTSGQWFFPAGNSEGNIF